MHLLLANPGLDAGSSHGERLRATPSSWDPRPLDWTGQETLEARRVLLKEKILVHPKIQKNTPKENNIIKFKKYEIKKTRE